MTRTISAGELFLSANSEHDRVDDLHAIVLARLDVAEFGEPAANNVVPFMRPKTNDLRRIGPEVVLPSDLARLPIGSTSERRDVAAFLILSLLMHATLAALLWREPPPLASIGVEVISVELVLGANAPAGAAPTPGENEVQSASVPASEIAEAEQAAVRATEQPQDVAVAKQETAPEQKDDTAEANKPTQVEMAMVREVPAAQASPSVAMIETRDADIATDKPNEATPEQDVLLPPQREDRPTEKIAEPHAVARKQAAPPKPVKQAAPAKEHRRIAAPTREAAAKDPKASTPSTQANNVGLGRSSNDTNYRGLVAAHLARYKQYPTDARSRGDGGTASVSFTIGGSGGVTSVRLAHGSGVASIDAEVQAMVRRASPFPAPPGGLPQNFTVPVSFRLN